MLHSPQGFSHLLCYPQSNWAPLVRMWGRWVLPATLPAPFSATLSPAFSVYLCANVGPQGLLVVRLPALFVPHTASLRPRQHESSLPRAHLHPSYQSG